jgi:hypothetical protein
MLLVVILIDNDNFVNCNPQNIKIPRKKIKT